MSLQEQVIKCYRQRFDVDPQFLVRAPGRVNLIGEHTDYNDGFVLPLAIDRADWIALRPREDRVVSLHSLEYDEQCVFNLEKLKQEAENWREYIKGVAWALIQKGYPCTGFEGVLTGDIPMGAGLSSSAALELVVARAFHAVNPWPWDPAEMALIGQVAENGWVGVNCGIMDQMVSAAGKAGHAILLDCRCLEYEAVPLPRNTSVVILDTATRRGLVESAYNERRQQCEKAAQAFEVKALRDISLDQFLKEGSRLDSLTYKRALHVVSENQRTLDAAQAMKAGNEQALGELMNASHVSLRDDFEVCNDALNCIVSISQSQQGCLGARMTGAGFGGCAVALVQSDCCAAFVPQVAKLYQKQTGMIPEIYVCQATNGAEQIEL